MGKDIKNYISNPGFINKNKSGIPLSSICGADFRINEVTLLCLKFPSGFL
jgi:hypothetical protein